MNYVTSFKYELFAFKHYKIHHNLWIVEVQGSYENAFFNVNSILPVTLYPPTTWFGNLNSLTILFSIFEVSRIASTAFPGQNSFTIGFSVLKFTLVMHTIAPIHIT